MAARSHAFATCLTLLLLGGCREPNANTIFAKAHGAAAAPNRLSGYKQPVVATLCNLEFIDGAAFSAIPVTVGSPVLVRGWLGSSEGAPMGPVLTVATVTGDVVARFPLALDHDRPDVVRAYPGRPGLERSGFEVTLDPAALASQEYHLYLAYASAGEPHVCDNGRRVRVSR